MCKIEIKTLSQDIRRTSDVVIMLNIELKESAVPHRKGASRMTPHKLDVYRQEIETYKTNAKEATETIENTTSEPGKTIPSLDLKNFYA